MNDDLLTRTEADVSIAIGTLLRNIRSFVVIQSPQRIPDAPELAQVKRQLLAITPKREPPHPEAQVPVPIESSFKSLHDDLKRMNDQMPSLINSLQELKNGQARDAVRAGDRFHKNHSVADKLVTQLEKELSQPIMVGPTLQPGGTQPSPPTDQEFFYNRLNTLLTRADLVGDYTHMWTIYERASLQHDGDQESLREAVYACDAVVHSLYREINGKKLLLKTTGEDLVTVFFESRLFTRVAKVPTPYVVAPYWGTELVWNWLAFGHEVGHHAYTNIGQKIEADQTIQGIALGDELFVHVTAYLLAQSDTTMRRIWQHWIEEIFADLFCLLRFGPVSARAMQHIFFHLPPKGLRRFLKPPPRHREWLLRADDDEHPIPYLRVFLALDTLGLLADLVEGQQSSTAQELRAEQEALTSRWNHFFSGQKIKLYHYFAQDALNPGEMRKIGHEIIKIMLQTPLYALAEDDALSKPRTLLDVFFDADFTQSTQVFNTLKNLRGQQFADTCQSVLINDADVRHVLAALQLLFEAATANQKDPESARLYLQELSTTTITLFGKYEEAHLLNAVPSAQPPMAGAEVEVGITPVPAPPSNV